VLGIDKSSKKPEKVHRRSTSKEKSTRRSDRLMDRSGNLRILVADNHAVARKGITVLLEERPGWEVVGEADNKKQTLQLLEELKPEVLVIDLFNIPGGNAGRFLPQVREIVPSTEIVVFTGVEYDKRVESLLANGVRAMVLKSDATMDLMQAVGAASRGKMYLSSTVAQLLMNDRASNQALNRLTVRELEILRLLGECKGPKEVASVLGLSSKAIGAHRAKIMRKLGLNSLGDLLRFAIRQNITKI
jgi:DNA-binding NarL/FixJ family response regulator